MRQAIASGTFKFLIKSPQDDLTVDDGLLDVADQVQNISVKRKTGCHEYETISRMGYESRAVIIPRLKDTMVYE